MSELPRLQPEQLYAAQRPLWIDDFLYVGWGQGDIPDLLPGKKVATVLRLDHHIISPNPLSEDRILGSVSNEFKGVSEAQYVAEAEYDAIEALDEDLETYKKLHGGSAKINAALTRINVLYRAEIRQNHQQMTRIYQELAQRATQIAQLHQDLFVIGSPKPLRSYTDTYVNQRTETIEFGARFMGASVTSSPERAGMPALEPIIEGNDGEVGLMPEGYGNTEIFKSSTMKASYLKKFYTFQPEELWTPAEIKKGLANGVTFDRKYRWTPKPYRTGPYVPPEKSAS